jgi:hypothetical protein
MLHAGCAVWLMGDVRTAMVYLALEPAAAREAIGITGTSAFSVWVGSDALTSDEFQRLIAEGVKVTRFSYPLSGASSEVVASALSTVEEHHPNEIIWVQHTARF